VREEFKRVQHRNVDERRVIEIISVAKYLIIQKGGRDSNEVQ
jgi:hypothetical protein